MYGSIQSVTLHQGLDNGYPEVVVRFLGIENPLILSNPEDADQTVHLFEYWDALREHGEMLFDHDALGDDAEELEVQ